MLNASEITTRNGPEESSNNLVLGNLLGFVQAALQPLATTSIAITAIRSTWILEKIQILMVKNGSSARNVRSGSMFIVK
jgi:hypothetical protein